MGANSKFHKIIGAAEVVVGAVLDYLSYGTYGNSLILIGLATFEGVPGVPAPQPSAQNYTLSSPLTPLQILYGATKVSGLLVAGDSDGSDPDYKYIAVAHSLTLKDGTSAIPLEGVLSTGNYYLDANTIFTSCVDPSTGAVSGSGSQGNNIDYDGIIWIKTYLGDQTVVDPWLTGALSYWTSDYIGKGIAYSVLKIHADPTSDQVNAAFPGGLPQTLAVELQGQKVYDPRLDSTAGGSGSQRKTDATTWTYSANPALCLRDYLVRPFTEGGAGVGYALIPDDFLAAAANRCDESLTIPNGSGGTVITVRFTCGVGLITSDGVPTNIQKLLDSMAGCIVETGGELRIYAGEYVAPVTIIDEDWLCGAPTFQTTAEQDTRWNTVNATFSDPQSAYTSVQTPSYAASGAVAADGGIPLTKNLNLPAVPNQYNAQYITQISAKQSREQRVLTLPCNLKALDVDCGEVVEVTLAEYDLSAAKFRVRNWQRKGDSSILLTLQQAKSTTYDDEAFTEISPLGQPPIVDQVPPAPTSVTATGKVGGIALDWDDLAPWAVATYSVYRSTSSGGTYTLLKSGIATSSYEDTIGVTSTYYYKIVAKNYLGKSSGYSSIVSATAVDVKDVVGGTGPNLMHARFAIVGSGTVPNYAVHTGWSVGRSATVKKYSYLALQLTSTGGGVDPVLALTTDVSDNSKPGWVQLNPKIYGVQVWGDNVSSDANGFNFQFKFYNAAGAACTGVAVTQVNGSSTEGVWAAELDLTGASDTLVYLQMEWQGHITSTHVFDPQGWGIFEMQGSSGVTPDFVAPPAPTQDDLQPGETYAPVLGSGLTNGQLDFSLAATDSGTGVESMINADTVNLTDGAQLGVNADMTMVTNLPATVASAAALGMMTDAQPSIGIADAVRQVLRSDGGDPYFDDPYSLGDSDAVALCGANFVPAGGVALTTSFATIGNSIRIPWSGLSLPVTIKAFVQLLAVSNGTTNNASNKLQISIDGGSTFTDSAAVGTWAFLFASKILPFSYLSMTLTGVPTGDIIIRCQAEKNGSTDNLIVNSGSAVLGYEMFASSNGNAIGTSVLTASLPATANASATTTYPTTSGTYTKNVTVTPGGGMPVYVYANVKTAGSGSIVSGGSSKTFAVSDTETCTTGGATHTTTVQSAVTDAQSYTMSTGATESGSTVTGTLTAAGLIPVGATIRMQNAVAAGYNGTALPVVAGTTGTTLKYTSGTSGLGASSHTGTVDEVTVTTGTCVITGTFTLVYPAVSVSLTGGSPARGLGVTGATAVATATWTVNATGGDGAFTYANSKTSGAGSVVSGATSSSFVVSDSGTVPGSDTGVYKSIVTDGHSHTGNASKTTTFKWESIS